MLLNQLEYFVTLAQEEHFGRAAAASFISQSTLSEAIRKLEIDLGVSLVHRGRTYEGLTTEGEMVLVWARKMLADRQSLSDELSASREQLVRQVRFGVIPSGTSAAAAVVSALARAHPRVTAELVTSMNSDEIVQRVRNYDLDVGVIHPSAAVDPALHVRALPEVRSVVVAHSSVFPEDTEEVTGAMLARAPLCLLEPRMRARQIFDQAMEAAGLHIRPRIESDSVEGLLAMVSDASWAAVVPGPAVAHRLDASVRIFPLIAPLVSTPIALIRLREDPTPAIAAAIDQAVADTHR